MYKSIFSSSLSSEDNKWYTIWQAMGETVVRWKVGDLIPITEVCKSWYVTFGGNTICSRVMSCSLLYRPLLKRFVTRVANIDISNSVKKGWRNVVVDQYARDPFISSHHSEINRLCSTHMEYVTISQDEHEFSELCAAITYAVKDALFNYDESNLKSLLNSADRGSLFSLSKSLSKLLYPRNQKLKEMSVEAFLKQTESGANDFHALNDLITKYELLPVENKNSLPLLSLFQKYILAMAICLGGLVYLPPQGIEDMGTKVLAILPWAFIFLPVVLAWYLS